MEDLETALRTLIDELAVPGVIVSIRSRTYGNLEILHGYSNLETQAPMDPKLPFRIGSITKTFTGTMILQLVDEGKIKLDNPVNDYLLGIPNGQNITVREIGSMRSGLHNYSELPEFDAVLEADPYRYWSPAELLLLGVTAPPDFPPGTDFHYSNTNTVVLGFIIQRLDRESYREALQERMLTPLKLNETKFVARTTDPVIHGYVLEEGGYVDVTDYNDSWAWSAGELVSTVKDMHRYARVSIANHQTLSDAATADQRFWQNSDQVGAVIRRYGFQLIKLGTFLGHNGSLPGYNTYLLVSPQTRTSVVIVCNIQATSEDVGPANELALLVATYLR
jgi:D-alanyl-D-alanine carboxypeptidase